MLESTHIFTQSPSLDDGQSEMLGKVGGNSKGVKSIGQIPRSDQKFLPFWSFQSCKSICRGKISLGGINEELVHFPSVKNESQLSRLLLHKKDAKDAFFTVSRSEFNHVSLVQFT